MVRVFRFALFGVLFNAAVVLSCIAQTAPSSNTPGSGVDTRGSGRVATLRDQLCSGLEVRRETEFQFVDDVVALVEAGKLPRQLVLETFDYAREKPTKYPFQYFYRALEIRAARIGVTVKFADTPTIRQAQAAPQPKSFFQRLRSTIRSLLDFS